MERRCLTGAFLPLVAVAALVLPAAASATAAKAARAGAVEAGVVRELNTVRVAHGLRALRANTELESAARAHTVEMASLGYFSHVSADGSSFGQRVGHWYATPIRWSAGENLLWGTPQIGSARVVQLWLASPEHRANILDPAWRDVGCFAVHSDSAPGIYAGEPVTVITCDFGARR